MEFGFGQAEAVRAAVGRVPALEPLEILRDLQGHERTLVARRRTVPGTVKNPNHP